MTYLTTVVTDLTTVVTDLTTVVTDLTTDATDADTVVTDLTTDADTVAALTHTAVSDASVTAGRLVQSGGFTGGPTVRVLAQIVGLAVLSGLLAAVVALGYRWYLRERVPLGPTVLLGLAAVAFVLNTTAAFRQVLVDTGTSDPLALSMVVFNGVAFLGAAVAAPAGRRIGDRIAVDIVAVVGTAEVDADVGRLAQAVGHVVAVELPDDPDEIRDVEGYESVERSVKTAVAGKTMLFSRRSTVGDLAEQLAGRLTEVYDVGYVDAEVRPDGTVEYLALGKRAAGLGPSLAPGSAAVAVRADPPNAASAGDLVVLWEPPAATDGADRTTRGEGTGSDRTARDAETPANVTDSGPRRVTTAEIRAVVGDTVTLVVDEADADAVAGGEYRLVTLPDEPRAEREFAGLLRAADATMASVSVEPESTVAGATLDAVDGTVVAVKPSDDPLVPLPDRDRLVQPGDTLYVIAEPDAIRRVESD